MPVMDGIQMAKKIIKLDNPPIVIGNSGNTSKMDYQLAKSAGMKSYMKKPIQAKELIKILDKFYFNK
jgi:CheY-like chemotaxis protein